MTPGNVRDFGEVPTPLTSLEDTLAGRASSLALMSVVEGWLESFLRPWLSKFLSDQSVRDKTCLRLRLARDGSRSLVEKLVAPELLAVAHVAIQVTRLDQTSGPQNPATVESLEEILSQAGFYLRATNNGLEYRVDATVIEQAQTAAATAESYGRPQAATRLRSAWQAAYSLHPNPTESLAESIKAVEAVMVPTVVPNDMSAIYSKAVGQLKKTRGEWRFEVVSQKGDDSIDTVIAMLDRLGTAHLERHEGNVPPKSDTVEAARACVHLAATLVQWFSMGAVVRR